MTPPVLEALQIDLDDYRWGADLKGLRHQADPEGVVAQACQACPPRVCQPITGFRTGVIGHAPLETRYDQAVSYGIIRSEFDQYLLCRSGAVVKTGMPLSSAERSRGQWRINNEFEAPVLIGAGGHFCPVARTINASPAGGDLVTAQEIEFHVNGGGDWPVDGATPELYFAPDLRGYGWCFRKGDVINIGLGRADRHGLGAHVRAFADFLAARYEGAAADFLARLKPSDVAPGFSRASNAVSGGSRIPRWRGHAYLLYSDSGRTIVDEGVMLVGDAAGLAYQQSGEGIRPAVESGLLAAETLIQHDGRSDRRSLNSYREALTARFGHRGHSVLEHLPRRATIPVVRTLLRHSAWFARNIVVDGFFLRTAEPFRLGTAC